MPKPTQPPYVKFWGEAYPELLDFFSTEAAVHVFYDVLKELLQNNWTGPANKYANMWTTNPSAELRKEWITAVAYRTFHQHDLDIQPPTDDTKDPSPKATARRMLANHLIETLKWERTDQPFIDAMAAFDAQPFVGEPPVVELNGNQGVNVLKDDLYNDEGATAYSPATLEDLTPVQGGDVVDTSVVGKYTVQWSAQDEAGQTTTIERIVTVIEA